jgi:hypothetical protein
MGDFVSLTCPTCGGKLQVSSGIDRFACAHCGNEHIVKRGDGVIFLEPVVAGLEKVQTGVDKTASELAIKRLLEEIAALTAKRDREVGERQVNTVAPGILGVGALAGFSFFCWLITVSDPTSPSATTLSCILPGILAAVIAVIAIVVFAVLGSIVKREEGEIRSKYDPVIALKRKELLYHQDIVARY